MEASPFSIQLLSTTHIEKAESLSEWRPILFLYKCYTQLIYRRQSLCQNGGLSILYTFAIYNSYRKGRLSIRMEASPFSIQSLYTTHKNRGLALFDTMAIYRSHAEGRLSAKMEASPFLFGWLGSVG